MNNTQTQHLELALTSLKRVYETYRDQGLLSMYLWGSILRGEYNADSSDIDSIGIVTDSFPLAVQDEINEHFKESKSGLRDLRTNLIRLSEINGADAVTRIAMVIPPPLLLLEFNSWKHVAGQQFGRNDFAVPVLSTTEAACLNLNVVLDQYVSKIKSGDMTKWKSFLKQMMHVCHLINKQDGVFTPFSYIDLERGVIPENQKIIELLLQFKKDSYRLPQGHELDMIFSFITTLQAQYCKKQQII